MKIHMGEQPSTSFWCAVQVAPRRELIVSKILSNKGYDQFTPTFRIKRQWSDRVKHLEQPLFPGYVFCRIAQNVAGPIYSTPGVVRIVSCGGSISAVEEVQIDNLKKALVSGRPVRPVQWIAGQKVRIMQGPLAGLTGALRSSSNGRQLILSVDLLMKGASVTVDPADVTAEITETFATARPNC